MSCDEANSQLNPEDRLRLKHAEPVTVKLYGLHEVTLPGYLLLQLSGIVVTLGMFALSAEITSPRTGLGVELEKLLATAGPDRELLIGLAIWAPVAMLATLAFEVIEGVVVLSMFREKRTALRIGHE